MVGSSALLFSPDGQQIHQLDESGLFLAQRLIAGATVNELAQELFARGVDGPECAQWAIGFLREVSELGLLEAERVGDVANTRFRQRISVAGLTIRLCYSNEDLFGAIGQVFSHLLSDDPVIHRTFCLSAAGDFVMVTRGSGRAIVVPSARAGVAVKAMILDEVLQAAHQLCAIHAACLRGDQGAILLLGPPGAGKSTLCLELLDHGFGYSSDDITLVQQRGKVQGVALAPSLKHGTWELLARTDRDIAKLPVHVRPDGQTVRFLTIPKLTTDGPCDVAFVVKLRRSSKVNTRVEPLSSAGAVAELLKDARAPNGSCSVETFRSVAALVHSARCVELTYAEATDAAAAIRNLYYG